MIEISKFLRSIINKEGIRKLTIEDRLDTPKTYTFESGMNINFIANKITYPVIIKPKITFSK